MCDFISIAVPTSGTGVLSQWRRRRYAITSHNNPTLQRQLPADFSTWVLTTGGCSCDLCLRPASEEQITADEACMTLREDAVEIIQQVTSGFERVFLYIHQYRGDIATELLPAPRKERRDSCALSTSEVMRRDTLIELTKRRKR